MSNEKQNAVEKKPVNAVGFAKEVGELLYTGFENVTDDLISLPFLKIAQPNSPELLEGTGQVAGLKAGDLWNSVTGQVYGKAVQMILLGFDLSFLEWDKDGLGKLLGRHTRQEVEDMLAAGEATRDGVRVTRKANGADIRETQTFFVFLPEYPDDGVMLLSFKSTGLKHVRKWLTKARAMRWTLPGGKVDAAPLFGIVWSVNTVLNKNDQGNWYLLGDAKTLSASRVGTMLDDKYKALQEQVLAAAGFVKEVQTKVNLAGVRDVTDSAETKDEIPF